MVRRGERPGLPDDAGCIRDLSGIIPDLSGEHLSWSLSRISSLQVSQLEMVPGGRASARWRVAHFIAVGLNYNDHAHEANSPIPDEPILFNKAGSSSLVKRGRDNSSEAIEERKLTTVMGSHRDGAVNARSADEHWSSSALPFLHGASRRTL